MEAHVAEYGVDVMMLQRTATLVPACRPGGCMKCDWLRATVALPAHGER